MERDKYYSLTDVLRRFKISRFKYHQLIKDKNLPVESTLIDLGDYTIKTTYVKKEIIDALNLPLREKK